MRLGIDFGTTPEGRWTAGESIDGKGQFTVQPIQPLGDEPQLAPPDPRGHAQTEEMME